MTETLTQEYKAAIEKFYTKPFKFSYSSLNKLLYSPQTFFNWYILGEKEDKLESYLLEGKAIHCLLLEKEKFNDQFSILPGKIPTATSKKVVEAMYRLWKNDINTDKTLKDFSQDILDWLVVENTHQKLNSDEKRLEKVLLPECNEYFEYLKASEHKDVIDQEAYDRCIDASTIVKKNKKVSDLMCLGNDDFGLQTVYNELMLETDIPGLSFGLKGILDNIVVDHQKRIIFINDLKTSGKSISEFNDSLDYYKYWMQAAIYLRLAAAFLYEKEGDSVLEYKTEFRFVVIDKYNQVYPFLVTDQTMAQWQGMLNEVIKKAEYHYTKKDYTLPYEFALGQVVL